MVQRKLTVPHHQKGPALSCFAPLSSCLPIATPFAALRVTWGDGSNCHLRFVQIEPCLSKRGERLLLVPRMEAQSLIWTRNRSGMRKIRQESCPKKDSSTLFLYDDHRWWSSRYPSEHIFSNRKEDGHDTTVHTHSCSWRGDCGLALYPAPVRQSGPRVGPDHAGRRIGHLHCAPQAPRVCHQSARLQSPVFSDPAQNAGPVSSGTRHQPGSQPAPHHGPGSATAAT